MYWFAYYGDILNALSISILIGDAYLKSFATRIVCGHCSVQNIKSVLVCILLHSLMGF